jgi:hypothetical protein
MLLQLFAGSALVTLTVFFAMVRSLRESSPGVGLPPEDRG